MNLMPGVVLSDALLAAILATQLAQLGFEARLLKRQSTLITKVGVLWQDYKEESNER